MSLRAIPPLVGITTKGLVNNEISPSELVEVAAALQTQVLHDFAPIWHTTATVTAYPGGVVPAGTWPLIIQPKLDDPGALGYHTDDLNQPISYIEYTDTWTVTASHELLEMLADPWGNRVISTIDPRGRDFGRARVLVEVADPCEAYAYNSLDVQVSDFVLPHYYYFTYRGGPVTFLNNNVKKPLALAKDGYLSWLGSDRNWYQSRWFGTPSPEVVELGSGDGSARSLRSWIDAMVPPH